MCRLLRSREYESVLPMTRRSDRNREERQLDLTKGRCRHNLVVCSQCTQITDAAKRMADTINAKFAFYRDPFELRTKWMAFTLADGISDGNVYDSKLQAVRHVSNEKYYCFFCFRNAMGGVDAFGCQIFLDVSRHQYDIGAPLADPDDISGGKDNIISVPGFDRWKTTPTELDPDLRRLLREYGNLRLRRFSAYRSPS